MKSQEKSQGRASRQAQPTFSAAWSEGSEGSAVITAVIGRRKEELP